MDRRSFLRSLVVAAPAVIVTPGLLMRVSALEPLPMEPEHWFAFGRRAYWVDDGSNILRSIPTSVSPEGLMMVKWRNRSSFLARCSADPAFFVPIRPSSMV